jgi:hypothetical protein
MRGPTHQVTWTPARQSTFDEALGHAHYLSSQATPSCDVANTIDIQLVLFKNRSCCTADPDIAHNAALIHPLHHGCRRIHHMPHARLNEWIEESDKEPQRAIAVQRV